MDKQPCVYILASKRHGTLYVGVTSDLIQRIYQHQKKFVEGFTKKYTVDQLVYFEIIEDMSSAIKREKQLKGWNREWKIQIIEKNNPHWRDLYEDLLQNER